MITKEAVIECLPERASHIDPNLILAIIMTESWGDTWAVRYEPNWRWFFRPSYWAMRMRITDKTERHLQMCSWGLMQIMGATARELGFEYAIPRLCLPSHGIGWGSLYLLKQINRYNGNIPYAIAAYNAGSARKRKFSDKFVNQEYVDKVFRHWSELSSGMKK